jgi:hypothetical protein
MNPGKLLIVGAALIGAQHAWSVHQRSRLEHQTLAGANANGFIDVLMPDGAPPHTVLVFAPLNCPSDGAKRADAMAERLTALGIPNIRTSQYQASGLRAGQKELMEHTNVVMSGTIPVVIIDGMGKSNPSMDEIASEYRRNL